MLTATNGVAVVAAALIASGVGVWLFTMWAHRAQVLDVANERSSHRNPTPRGAGLVIVVITLIGAWTCHLWLGRDLPALPLAAFTSGGVLIAGVSWYDDIFGLSPELRLAVHGLGAAAAIWGIGYWRAVDLPLVGEVNLEWFGIPLTFLWIVGLTNAVNFMDGIDGITGTQAVIAAIGWAIVGSMLDDPTVIALGLLLSASCLGFLFHNWPPARVFLGDVGSAFLGYSFAVLPFLIRSAPAWSAVPAVLFVWPFVFDSGATFVRRLVRGENVFAAHRSHLYQRLALVGHRHGLVTTLYAGLAITGMLLALAWVRRMPAADYMVGVGLPLMCLLLWSLVHWQEHQPSRRAQAIP